MQKSQPLCLNNNCYNIVQQLSKTMRFLSRVDQYVDDADKAGDKESEKVWSAIKTDRQKHAELLRNLIINEIKNNKF
jgi:hypothetical protein